MKLCICGVLAITAVAVSCLLDSTQSLAQNAYITNSSSNSLSVIDTEKNKVSATIVGAFFSPYGVTVSPDSRDGSKVYVTNSTASAGNSNVSVIDTATNKVIATIPVGSEPVGVAVSTDGSKAYVANANSATVSVIDTATNTVIATIPVGVGPYGVAVGPDGSKVYVTNTLLNSTGPRGTVSVIDTAKNTVTATILVDGFPTGVAVTPDGRKIYVANVNSDSVSVIDTAKNKVTATIPVGTFRGPNGVAVTADGRKVYVTNFRSNNVSVIDTAKNKVTATIPVGLNPNAFGIFIHPAREREPRFAGKPGTANCHGRSVAALAQQYGRLNAAATTLGYSDESDLQNAIRTFCRE
jgi:YVTN family beta-propeller protein